MTLKKNTTKMINLRRQRNINNVISVTFSSLSLLFYSYSNLPVSTFLYFFLTFYLLPLFLVSLLPSGEAAQVFQKSTKCTKHFKLSVTSHGVSMARREAGSPLTVKLEREKGRTVLSHLHLSGSNKVGDRKEKQKAKRWGELPAGEDVVRNQSCV